MGGSILNKKKNKILLMFLIIGVLALVITMLILTMYIRNSRWEEEEIEEEEIALVIVFFVKDTSDDRIEQIGQEILEIDGVNEIKYMPGAETGDTFKDDYFQGSQDLAEGFKDDNPLGNSNNYEVYVDEDKIQDVVVAIERIRDVRAVNRSDFVKN